MKRRLFLFTIALLFSGCSGQHLTPSGGAIPATPLAASRTATPAKSSAFDYVFAPGQDATTDVCNASTGGMCVIQGQSESSQPWVPLICPFAPVMCGDWTFSATPSGNAPGVSFAYAVADVTANQVESYTIASSPTTFPTGYPFAITSVLTSQAEGSANYSGPATVQVLCSLKNQTCGASPAPNAVTTCLPTPPPGPATNQAIAVGRARGGGIAPKNATRRTDALAGSVVYVSPCGTLVQGAPPPPIALLDAAPATSFVASILSNPHIVLNDSADSGTYGSLTWNVSIDKTTFSNVVFQTSTTSGAPNANALSFSVPQQTAQATYQISVTVTSSTTGQTSNPLTLTLQIIPIQTLNAASNDAGYYQLDATGSSTADTPQATEATPTPAPTPNFPFVGTSNSVPTAIRRSTAASSKNQFDPTHPPALDAAYLFLLAEAPYYNFGACASIEIPDNGAHDHTSSTSPAFQTVYVYCKAGISFSGAKVTVLRSAYAIDTGKPFVAMPETYQCNPTGQNFLGLSICETPDIPFHLVTGHAELQVDATSFFIGGGVGIPALSARYPLNSKMVIYPAVFADRTWGPGVNFLDPLVPFPAPGKWTYCTKAMMVTNPAECHGLERAKLRQNLKANGYVDPGSTSPALSAMNFEAHHVQEISWGGDNDYSNGVWIPHASHIKFTTWFNRSNFGL